MQVLEVAQWQAAQQAHVERARKYTAEHIRRRRAGEKHPVFDFLFEYYPIKAAHVERWHPGVGVGLTDPDASSSQAGWQYYHHQDGVTAVDVAAIMAKRGQSFEYIRGLLAQTMVNPAHFDCFGLHEWAMVYRSEQVRHDLPLRLGAAETDAVVEAHAIKCTHFDAYRFFTPAAQPLNLTILTREAQASQDQRGCLHATMDLYKWAAKLGPIVPGQLWLDTFELAWEARILDMEASPYDCRSLGLNVVAIETAAGKQEYVRRQRDLAQRGEKLRYQLVSTIERAFALNYN